MGLFESILNLILKKIPLPGRSYYKRICSLVILSEAKNLILSIESTVEILRIPPQNDITTQEGEG
jgi:hypothetical protein